MIFRTGIIIMLSALFFYGCSATKTVTWKAQDISFSGFRTFEILPVFDATDTHVSQEVIVYLTAQLEDQFTKQNLQLVGTPQTISGVIRVQSDIMFYSKVTQVIQGSTNYAVECSVITRLVEKSSTRVVAKISTKESVSGQFRGDKLDKLVLKKSAAEIAQEVAKIMMQPEEPLPGILQDI